MWNFIDNGLKKDLNGLKVWLGETCRNAVTVYALNVHELNSSL